jgi:hypothetical protein
MIEYLTVARARIRVTSEYWFDARVLRAGEEWFVLTARLESQPSLEAARVHITGMGEVTWREVGPDAEEQPCPICEAGVPKSSRYPRELCPACVLEAANDKGEALSFSNTELLGHGFVAVNGVTGERTEDETCFVRRIRCRAREAYFGGIVVERVD